MTNTKVRIYLDVDGVINACSTEPEGWKEFKSFKALGFKITYSPVVCEALAHYAQLPGIDMKWLTTWDYNANKQIGEVVGIPSLDVAAKCDFGASNWWKWDAVKAAYEEDGLPFIWIDDDLKYEKSAVAWLYSIDSRLRLGLSPDTSHGLQIHDFKVIDNFLDDRGLLHDEY